MLGRVCAWTRVPRSGEDAGELIEEMKELSAARGERFDRLFLRGMIRHHAGAVDMAEEAAQDGRDVIVGEMTADVAAIQSAEIDRMQDILARL